MTRNVKSAAGQSSAEPQEEMTVMFVRLKGSSTSLQKGFEAFRSAFEASAPVSETSPKPGKTIEGRPTAQLSAPAGSQQEEDAPVDTLQVEEEQSPRQQRSSGPRKPPKFMDDYDLNGDGVTWWQFSAPHESKSDVDKYLIASLWLTQHGNTPEFTTRHIFTCFRAAKWNEQADFSQPMRHMKSRKSYLSKPSEKTWKLTGPGLNAAQAAVESLSRTE